MQKLLSQVTRGRAGSGRGRWVGPLILLLLALALLLGAAPAWAAFPTVAGTATTEHDATDATVEANLPTPISSGDLLIVCVAGDATVASISPPTGWTELFDTDEGQSVLACAYRRADGTEGSTATFTLSATDDATAHAYRITGHHATSDPEDASQVNASATTIALPNLAPSWGTAEDVLWIAVGSHGLNEPCTDAPTNYTNLLGTGEAASVTICSARRNRNASSENPDDGFFAHTTSIGSVGATLAVRPASSCLPTRALMGVGC